MKLRADGVSKKGLRQLFAHYGTQNCGIKRIARLLRSDEETVIQAGIDAGLLKRERINKPLESEQKAHPCTGCVWGKCFDQDSYYCISPKCLKKEGFN